MELADDIETSNSFESDFYSDGELTEHELQNIIISNEIKNERI